MKIRTEMKEKGKGPSGSFGQGQYVLVGKVLTVGRHSTSASSHGHRLPSGERPGILRV